MEQIKKDGLAKSIGVSNFREEDLLAFEGQWEIPPAVNQVSLVACMRANEGGLSARALTSRSSTTRTSRTSRS